jgi:prepilin-type N-terminal cleavage/methylation domain-containing protein
VLPKQTNLHQKRKERIHMENKTQDKGFTLVELLIVIVILGILATVTVFAVRGITDKGQENACEVEQRTLDTAIEAYYAQNQADPATVAALTGGTTALLKQAPDTAKFTFAAGPPASFTAIGVCV